MSLSPSGHNDRLLSELRKEREESFRHNALHSIKSAVLSSLIGGGEGISDVDLVLGVDKKKVVLSVLDEIKKGLDENE